MNVIQHNKGQKPHDHFKWAERHLTESSTYQIKNFQQTRNRQALTHPDKVYLRKTHS